MIDNGKEICHLCMDTDEKCSMQGPNVHIRLIPSEDCRGIRGCNYYDDHCRKLLGKPAYGCGDFETECKCADIVRLENEAFLKERQGGGGGV